MHHWRHRPVHRCCYQHPRPGVKSGCCPGQKWVLSWVFMCINGVWLNNLSTYYIVLGLRQEEQSCPYTWLPFTGEQKIQDLLLGRSDSSLHPVSIFPGSSSCHASPDPLHENQRYLPGKVWAGVCHRGRVCHSHRNRDPQPQPGQPAARGPVVQRR